MAKTKGADKPQRFGLLEAARGQGWNRQEKWIDRLPQEIRQEVEDTCATLAKEPAGSVSCTALARALIRECERQKLPHLKEQAIAKYFGDTIKQLRQAQ